ncbi:MAG: hypothetical protein QM773_13240 [Hyphomonadaceae bacterium]
MKQKFSESRIVGALMAVLVVEIILLLLHLGVLSFHHGAPIAVGSGLAGHVVKSQNDLRRRGADSLVWEKSSHDEAVYFHDSVLTLSQSTATLLLQKDTEIHLSENTLVTIEPASELAHGEIRLHFVKGNLKARNPYNSTLIQGAEWTVDLHQGSEVELRQVNGEDFELQVGQGEAHFKSSKSGESVIKPKEVLRVSHDQALHLALDAAIEWTRPPPSRMYTHSESMAVALQWHGQARQLILQSLGQPEVILDLPEGRQSYQADLPLGQHRLFLRQGLSSSAPLNLQVWRAPVLHLLRPLPRDRVSLDRDVAFLWTPLAGVSQFILRQDSGGAGGLKQTEVHDNSASTRFSSEEDLQWSVSAKDAEGFEIPPLYSYPLFVRENPLAPPKLRVPQLRRPASSPRPGGDSGASFWWRAWNTFLPRAEADDGVEAETYEAVFEWEPVSGADQYVLEISASEDFRHPVLIKTTTRSQYAWRGFLRQSYFWRVAAGTKRGRLGVFSEPAVVDLRQLEGHDVLDGVLVRRVEKPVTAATRLCHWSPRQRHLFQWQRRRHPRRQNQRHLRLRRGRLRLSASWPGGRSTQWLNTTPMKTYTRNFLAVQSQPLWESGP